MVPNLISFLVVLAGLCIDAALGWSDKCADLVLPAEALYTASLLETYYYGKGQMVNITDVNGGGLVTNQLPAFCRVVINVPYGTSGKHSAVSEIWLPDSWSSRLLAVGNGGFAGNIARGDLAFQAVDLGFIGVGTDTGHVGTAFTIAPFLIPEVLEAFTGDYPLIASTKVAVLLAEAYYGSPVGTKIFSGCSTGGRQAFSIVESWPSVYDGVIGGDPDNWHSHNVAAQIQNQAYFAANTSGYMSAYQWSLLGKEALRQCDRLDGVMDGVLNDPRVCPLRPEVLACSYGQNTSECLSPDQISAVKKIYNTWTDLNATYVFGGYYPGSESTLGPEISAGGLGAFGIISMQNLYTDNSDYSIKDWNTANPPLELLYVNPGHWDAYNPNITAFLANKGKLMHYHGSSDPLISPASSVEWFETLHSFVRTHTTINLTSSYQFFPVPGMAHCSGGPGAVAFGGQGQAASGYPSPKDAKHQIVLAMAEWIEQGKEPDLVTTKWEASESDVPAYVSDGLQAEFSRPLCAFPTFARYIGGGADNTKASSFECY